MTTVLSVFSSFSLSPSPSLPPPPVIIHSNVVLFYPSFLPLFAFHVSAPWAADYGRYQLQSRIILTVAATKVSQFFSREHLLQSVTASCHVPHSFHPFDSFWSVAPRYHASEGKSVQMSRTGELEPSAIFCVDGAFSDFLPVPPGQETIRITPFSGVPQRNFICPKSSSRPLFGNVSLSGIRLHRSLHNL
jgi:hypothetical protein